MKIYNLPILIKWNRFKPGTSFFIPCIDRVRMEKMLKREAERIKVDVLCRHVIEEGVYGLRVWRPDDTLPTHSPSTQQEG